MNIMKTDKFILGLSLLALVACSESEVTDRPEPTPGADVKFGVSLDKTDTRTIYGDEDGNALFVVVVHAHGVSDTVSLWLALAAVVCALRISWCGR